MDTNKVKALQSVWLKGFSVLERPQINPKITIAVVNNSYLFRGRYPELEIRLGVIYTELIANVISKASDMAANKHS